MDDIYKLLTLAAIVSPSLFALLLTNFLPASDQATFGLGMFGLLCSVITMAVTFFAERNAKHNTKSQYYTFRAAAFCAAVLCLCVLLSFFNASR